MILPPQKRIAQHQRHIVCVKIERNSLFLPQQFASLYFHLRHREREELFGGIRPGGSADGRRRLVRRTVWIHNDVDHRMLNKEGVEANLSAEERDNLDFRLQAIDMQVRNLVGRFPSVNSQIANIDAQPERNGMKLADFNAASSSFLECCDNPAANCLLK